MPGPKTAKTARNAPKKTNNKKQKQKQQQQQQSSNTNKKMAQPHCEGSDVSMRASSSGASAQSTIGCAADSSTLYFGTVAVPVQVPTQPLFENGPLRLLTNTTLTSGPPSSSSSHSPSSSSSSSASSSSTSFSNQLTEHVCPLFDETLSFTHPSRNVEEATTANSKQTEKVTVTLEDTSPLSSLPAAQLRVDHSHRWEIAPFGCLNTENNCFVSVVIHSLLACDPLVNLFASLCSLRKRLRSSAPVLSDCLELFSQLKLTPVSREPKPKSSSSSSTTTSVSSSSSSSTTRSTTKVTPPPPPPTTAPTSSVSSANTARIPGSMKPSTASSAGRTRHHSKAAPKRSSWAAVPTASAPVRIALDAVRPVDVVSCLASTLQRFRRHSPALSSSIAQPRRYTGAQQHDCHEFMCFLLSELHTEFLSLQDSSSSTSGHLASAAHVQVEEWCAVGKGKRDKQAVVQMELENSVINRMFGFQVRSTVEKRGAQNSATLEPSFHLSLDVGPHWIHSVSDALSFFLSREAVGLRCSKSGANLHALKTNTLESLPAYLVIQLKRFDVALDAHQVARKLSKEITYPSVLIMDRSQLSSEILAPAKQQRSYDLVSVISHLGGTVSSGHYTCDVRHTVGMPPQQQWIHFDDSRVSPIMHSTVLSSCAAAYVLVYKRRVCEEEKS